MPIPMVDLKAEYNSLKREIDKKITKVLNSGHFILGPEVESLEKDIAKYCNTRFSVGVASGTEALHLALIACGVGKGDEVITTSFTFVATAEVVSHLGAIPVFVDINQNNFNIDAKLIASKITKRTKAIIPVHLYGQASDMDAIIDIAKENGIMVIEDCAQAFGAEYKNRKVGSIGDAGCFSFYPAKNLGCYGDGGMVVTSNKDIYQKVKLLRQHGAEEQYNHKVLGFNSRLDELQAAILGVKLKYLDEWNSIRRERAELYNKYLYDKDIILPIEESYNHHVYNQYTIRIKNRDKIREGLQSKKIASAVHYPIPLHQQPIYKNLSCGEGELAVSERISKEVLSLPMSPYINPEQVKEVSDCLLELIEMS
ncbi:MAG: DegT/DnrJ/EryC1/StrS family aminotransferase [bacterium]